MNTYDPSAKREYRHVADQRGDLSTRWINPATYPPPVPPAPQR